MTDADEIRINMVVNRFEHPELFALLAANPSKVRASLLRQFGEFGLWIKKSGNNFNAPNHLAKEMNEPISQPIERAKPKEAPLLQNHISQKASKEPPVDRNVSPTLDVLDTSVLSDYDLAGLD